jgi:asparagine synthase (glutamine-hydrolysing)
LEASYPGRLARRFQQHTTARELSLELVTGGHLPMLLHWEDRNSMAHSVESRVPFLDYRLVEFCVGLPDQFKINGGLTKAVLRRGMRGIVPDTVLQRTDKMGFVTPEEVWAKESGTQQFRAALADAVTASQGILTASAKGCFEKMIDGQTPYSSSVWRMICLGRWMQRFSIGT